MITLFNAHAISRQDGSESDGILIFWTAPNNAGYSVKGFDIQRRESGEDFKVDCDTLGSNELQRLHTDLRVTTRLATISVREDSCPRYPELIPDEPLKETDKGFKNRRRQQWDGGDSSPEQQFIFPNRSVNLPATTVAATMLSLTPMLQYGLCLRYEIDLGSTYQEVQVDIGVAWAMGIAMRGDKAVASDLLHNTTGIQNFRFRFRSVDRVLVFPYHWKDSLLGKQV